MYFQASSESCNSKTSLVTLLNRFGFAAVYLEYSTFSRFLISKPYFKPGG